MDKLGAMKPHPQALPNYENAVIPTEKTIGYVLNPYHARGADKAKVFAALGFTQENADDLSKQILQALPMLPSVEKMDTEYGKIFSVDVPVVGPISKGVVRTGWILQPGEKMPRLTTAYVLREKNV